MRWKNTIPLETRIIKKFLWFPTRIKNETRWLEFVKIKQQYYTVRSIMGIIFYWWENVSWEE